MNEEALNDAYALFSSKGYNGGIKEFKSLIGSNPDALKDSYTLFRSSGYNGDINQYSELVGLKKKGPSDFTTPKVAMESPTGAGSLGPVETQPKKKVTITTPDGTPAIVEWGPTQFKSSDEAPVPDMRLSDIVGNVDATIDEATKNKLATAIGVTGGVLSKIIGLSPNKTTGEAILDTKKFLENTATAYNVGALGAQILNNQSDDVPDIERIAALKKEQNQESKKLLSSQMKGQGVGDFFDIMATSPATYLTEILTTSATQLAGGVGSLQVEEIPLVVGLGALTGGAGARGYLAGRNSLAAEMSSRTLDKLEENGVDTTDPVQLRAAFENKELMGTIAKEIEAPSTIVAALDIVSAMVAGGLGTPVKEIAAQMAAGSIGEAGAQIAESGRITAPAAILTEAIAELPGGLAEIGFAAKTKDITRKAQVNRDIKDIEGQIESTEDAQTKDILLSELNKLRGEKNQIFKEYVDFANSLPEEQVAQLNELNQEVVKLTKAIESVGVDSVKKSLSQQRDAAIAKIVELESQVTPKTETDAVQEQTAGEIPVQPGATVGEEVAQGEPQAEPQVPSQGKVDVITIAERQSEAESKIKRTDLFTGVGDFSTQLGGSDKAAVPVSHSENNGIEIVEYAHPETGSVDVIVTGKSDNNFVGFYRLYENGKPTNRWSSKFENLSRNKEDFKTMISGVQALLPEGHEYTEKTSISTDGLRVWNQQLSRGYELQYDENGNVITNRVYVNGDAIENELGVNVEKGKFEPVRATEREFEKAKEVLVPYLDKLGLSSKNIYFESTSAKLPPGVAVKGRIAIDLPVLKSQPVKEGSEVAPVVEEVAVEEVPSETQNLTEADLPGFDRMITELDGVVKKSEQRRASREKTFENAMNYVVGSNAYETATDVQRESLVRMVNKRFGKRMKSAPSVGRIFDTIKDIKKITMSEYALLKNQIQSAARGAKDAKVAIANASKSVGASIQDLSNKGRISLKQAASLTNRFAETNPLDEVSVERFVNYASKVFSNAEYAAQLAGLAEAIPLAKENAQSKLGIAEDLVQPLLRIFSIKPDAIPDSVFETYRELVDIMSKRKAVLELPDIPVLREKAQLVTDAVQLELSMVPFLADVFNAYTEKVLTKDGKLDYAATVNKMVKEEIITIEDGQILRDFRSSVLPIVEKAKRSEAEIQKERALLLDYISESSIKANELPSRDERKLAQELADLIKTDAVESLGKVVTEDGKMKYNNELNKLALTIDNINNGFLPHYAQLFVERLTAINKLKILDKTIPLAKPLRFSKFEGTVKSLLVPDAGKPLTEMLRFGPAYYLDQSFGIFKGKPLFDSVFGPTAEGSERYKSLSEQIQNRLKAAEEAVFKSNNYDFNESMMSKFKMMTYLRELEFLSNQGSKQVNPATAFIKATIQHIKGRNAIYSDSDKAKLESILEDYTEDGAVKMKKLYDSFNSAEKKAIEEIQSINAELRDKALFTSVVIRGDKIELLDNYMPLNVMYVHRPQDALIGDAFINTFNESINASTRAKTLISRTGEVNAINFDVFSSTSRAANYVLTDYYMTKPIRTARKTIALAEKSLNEQGNPQEQQDVLNAVKKVFEESVLGFLGDSFSQADMANDAVKFVTRQGYRTTLAGTGKFVVELISNISSAVLFDPAALNIGMKLRDVVFSSIGPKVMGALKAKQQSRLYPNDTLSGRLIDPSIMNQAAGAKGSRSKSDIANRMQQIYNSFFIRKYVNSVALLADSLISTPDKMVTRPFWFGAFTNEFEKLTGKKPDFDLIADNDEQYMNENKSALDKATNLADEKAVFIGSTNNSFMGILAGKQKKGKGGLGEAAINILSAFNNYMLSFIKYDFFAARTAIYAMRRQGTLTPRQGAALLAAVTVRQTIYSVLLPMAAALIISTVYRIAAAVRGEEYEEPEDEDEKSFAQRVLQSIISTITSLFVGRDFGNIVKAPMAYAVERGNQEFLDFLRNGEYDAYEDQIMFSQIPADERSKNGRSIQDLNYVIFGPIAPFLRTADKAVRVYTAPPKKEKAAIDRANMEKTVRMPFEFIGLIGGIPFYKDAKSVLFNSMYKDLEKAEKTAGGVSKMGKQDMERLYPDVYNQLYGPGGSMIDYEQLKKEIRKEKELVRKAAKD